jgi:hypothetical protein
MPLWCGPRRRTRSRTRSTSGSRRACRAVCQDDLYESVDHPRRSAARTDHQSWPQQESARADPGRPVAGTHPSLRRTSAYMSWTSAYMNWTSASMSSSSSVTAWKM